MSATNKGKIRSEETKAKMSAAKKRETKIRRNQGKDFGYVETVKLIQRKLKKRFELVTENK